MFHVDEEDFRNKWQHIYNKVGNNKISILLRLASLYNSTCTVVESQKWDRGLQYSDSSQTTLFAGTEFYDLGGNRKMNEAPFLCSFTPHK